MSIKPMKFEAEGSRPSASSDLPPLPAPKPNAAEGRGRLMRSRIVTAVAFALLVIALCLGATYTPWYREWRMSRASLSTLQKEVGTRRGGYDSIVLYHLGKRLNEAGRFAEADPLLSRAVGLDTNSPRLRDEWARALLGAGLTTAAFGQLQEFAGTHPNSAEAHLILGKFYVTQNSMTRAIEEFEKTVALAPKSGEGWAYLAVAHKEMGSSGPALQAARKAVALRPDDAGDRLRLALLLSSPGTPDDARKAFEEALRVGPKVAEAHRAFAAWLMQSGSRPGDLAQATSEARQAVALAPTSADAHLTLGRVLLREGKVQDAWEPLKTAAGLAPFDPSAPRALVQAAQRLGRADDALTWEKTARGRQEHLNRKQAVLTQILADPEKPEPHRRMARLLAVEGDIVGCLRNHARALRRPLDAPPVLVAAANDLTAAGSAEDAVSLARRATVISRASPAAQDALGNALLADGKAREAAEAFDRVCVFWPDRFEGYRKRLEVFHRNAAAEKRREAVLAAQASLSPAEQAYRKSRAIMGSQVGPLLVTPEALTLAQQAVSLEPASAAYLRHLLNLQFELKHRETVETAKRLLAVAPQDARGNALLALLLVDSANSEADFAAVRSHLEVAAKEPTAAATYHYGMGLLALRQKDGEAAVRELKQAAKLDPEPEVTYYKLFLAYRMIGERAAASAAQSESVRRRAERRTEAEALKKLSERSHIPAAYVEAAKVFEAHGRTAQAQAIRAAAPPPASSVPPLSPSITPSAPPQGR